MQSTMQFFQLVQCCRSHHKNLIVIIKIMVSLFQMDKQIQIIFIIQSPYELEV